MAKKYLDDNGLLYLWQKIVNVFAQKSDIASTLTAYAPKASPAFTGTPTAPTAAANNNTTQVATTAFVKTAIDNAVAGISQIHMEIVQELPQAGVFGTIYLIEHSHGYDDNYDEYIWTGVDFEKIGNTDIDLSGYMLKTDMEAITNAEIDTIVAS